MIKLSSQWKEQAHASQNPTKEIKLGNNFAKDNTQIFYQFI